MQRTTTGVRLHLWRGLVCVLKSTVCGGLAVRSPLRLCNIRIYKIFVGNVQFEDTVPAIQVWLWAGWVVGVGMVLVLCEYGHKTDRDTLSSETCVMIHYSYRGQQKPEFLTSSSLSSGLAFFFSFSFPFFLASSFFFFSFSGRRSSSQARSCWEKTMSSIFRTTIRPRIWGFGTEIHRGLIFNSDQHSSHVRVMVWMWFSWMVFADDSNMNHWNTQWNRIIFSLDVYTYIKSDMFLYIHSNSNSQFWYEWFTI